MRQAIVDYHRLPHWVSRRSLFFCSIIVHMMPMLRGSRQDVNSTISPESNCGRTFYLLALLSSQLVSVQSHRMGETHSFG
jgi:hypothetical protein